MRRRDADVVPGAQQNKGVAQGCVPGGEAPERVPAAPKTNARLNSSPGTLDHSARCHVQTVLLLSRRRVRAENESRPLDLWQEV